MENKNLLPQLAQPVNRTITGLLPLELAELSEEGLSQLGADTSSGSASSASVLPSSRRIRGLFCSYDGDDAE